MKCFGIVTDGSRNEDDKYLPSIIRHEEENRLMFALLDMPDISQSIAHTMFDTCNRVLRNYKLSWKNVLHASQILVTLWLENAKMY